MSDITNLLYISDKDDGSISHKLMGFVVDASNFYLSETKNDDKINLWSVVNEGGEYTFRKQNPYIKDELSHKQRSDFSESLMKDLKKKDNV